MLNFPRMKTSEPMLSECSGAGAGGEPRDWRKRQLYSGGWLGGWRAGRICMYMHGVLALPVIQCSLWHDLMR